MKLFQPARFALLAITLFAARLHAAAPTDFLYDSEGVVGFQLYEGGIYWWDEKGLCSGEFVNQAHIKLRGTLNGNTRTNSRACEIRQGPHDRPVRDDNYVYFFREGQLHRKAVNAGVNDPSEAMNTGPLTPTLGANLQSAVLELANGYLYFARFTGNVVDVYRFKTDGSQPPQYVVPIVGGGNVVKMKLFNYNDSAAGTIDALLVLLDNGKLYRRKFNANGSTSQVGSGILDFAVHSRTFIFGGQRITDIYAAKGTLNPGPQVGAGSLVRINPDTGANSTVYTAPGDNQVISVATDGDELVTFDGEESQVYFAETSVSCGDLFCSIQDTFIYRNTTPGTDGSWSLLVQTGGGVNLQSDGKDLWFTRTNTIKRISTQAAPIQFDIQADALEVVQITQRPTNGLPLIAYRDGTFVRGFASLRTNTTGVAAWSPTARLSVFINGEEIPGSPFQNINNAVITTNRNVTMQRTNLPLAGFLFELPRLAPGILTMAMTVNPEQVMVETGPSPYANNSVLLPSSVQVVDKGMPCLVMLPVNTPWGTYTHTSAGFYDILDRARSMLPVQALWFFSNHSPFENLLTGTMFNAGITNSGASNGQDAALDTVESVAEQTADPTGCPDTHWIGMIHPGTTNFNGLGFTPGRSVIVRMETNANGRQAFNAPLGGRTMAHELGHNYGRNHINCNNPANPDMNYPYDPCTIGSNTPNAWVGFDSISQMPIAPGTVGDLLSYGFERWVSDYTFNAIYGSPVNKSLSASKSIGDAGKAAAAKALGDGPVLLVQGRIFVSEGGAQFQTFYQYPAGAADAKRLEASVAKAARAGDSPNPFRIVLLDGAGHELGSTPIETLAPDDHDAPSLHFIQYIPFHAGTRRVLLVRGGQIFAERIVTAHAPTLSLAPVNFDAVNETLTLSWNATDADGDKLVFAVHYSHDNGQSWKAMLVAYPWQDAVISTALLPGGTQARVRVMATDGVNSTTVVSPPFNLPTHAPKPQITGVNEGERIPFGTVRKLEGVGFDGEEGSLGPRLSWQITGPTPLTGNDATIMLRDLAPGAYTAVLSATDTDNQTGTTTKHFEIVMSVPDAPEAPVLDGFADGAYKHAPLMRIPLGNGKFASARMVHHGTDLFIAFSDLQLPAGRVTRRTIGLRVDRNASGNPTAQPDDLGFFVDDSGIPFQQVGKNGAMSDTLTPLPGFKAMVKRAANGWCAEMRIAEELLGGWNHLARLMLDHDGFRWPVQSAVNSPATWSPVWLGNQLPAGENRPPVADAGKAQKFHIGKARTVVLDGSMSFDPDGDALTFSWTQISGPMVVLENTNAAVANFTANPVSSPTTLTFRLKVKDGSTNTATADTKVTLLPTSTPAVPAQLAQGRLQSNGFQLRFDGEPGKLYILQGTTNLVDWTNIRTNTADFQGVLDYVDFEASQHPFRFYRTLVK
jgi:hypothetical protein